MNIAVLLSGRGSNLQALHRAVESGEIQGASISCVISDKEAAGLVYARENGIKSFYLPPKDFASRQDYDRRILEILEAGKADLICLAGYMRLLSDVLIDAYEGKILNVHPSLLPAFPGLDAHKQALEYGVKLSGCTVHFVDGGLDTGPVILQQSVTVYSDDTVETLSERILKEEHKLYPKAVSLYVEGKLQLKGRTVTIRDDI